MHFQLCSRACDELMNSFAYAFHAREVIYKLTRLWTLSHDPGNTTSYLSDIIIGIESSVNQAAWDVIRTKIGFDHINVKMINYPIVR